MLPRNIFENLHTVMAILVLFEKFLGKFCLNINKSFKYKRNFPENCSKSIKLNFECFTKYEELCSLSFDYAQWRTHEGRGVSGVNPPH